MDDNELLWSLLDDQLTDAQALRRRLHAAPDLSGDEAATRDLVMSCLPPSGVIHHVADTGAVIRIGGPGMTVGIRGEMDALPITEQTGAPFASTRTTAMHACGHDVHLAAVTAVARAVAAAGPGAPCPLLVVLQPREETYPSGAQDIVGSGVLEDEQCTAMVGAHLQPSLDADVVACVPGGVNASSDEFTITVTGESGHAAYPHLTRDPVLALSSIVVALQSLVSRDLDPMTPAVLGVSSLRADSAANVVPAIAVATGTIRALSSSVRENLHDRVTEVAELVARTHRCTADLAITRGEPVLENHPGLALDTAGQLEGRGFSLDTGLRSVGSDDFSFYGQIVASVMMFVGTDGREALHTPTFLPSDDDVVRVARAMMAGYLAAAKRFTGI